MVSMSSPSLDTKVGIPQWIVHSGALRQSRQSLISQRYPPLTTIRVDELGNGWLYESMIMRLKVHYSIQQVKNELIQRGVKNVFVREGGG